MEVIRNFPDQELVDNLRSGQRVDEMIRSVYRNNFDSLSWYVINNSGNQQDAEDVFQEVVVTFIDLVQKDKFRGESTVKTFLFSLNRHIWLNELKRRGRAIAREEKYERAQDRVSPDTSVYIAERENKNEIIKLVGKLGDKCRQILLLFYYESWPMKEILETMNYENEQVLRNKKYKCLKQLEQLLNSNPNLKNTLKNLLHG
jgi:RNA polymerase sigma factor (sigma-70 family)